MICKRCGFQNPPGAVFCGNCGVFLEWSAEGESGAASGATEPTSQAPPAESSPTDITQPVTTQFTQAAGAGIVCWNCGRQNPASRSFCQQCGERLELATRAGSPAPAVSAGAAVVGTAGDGGGTRRTVAIIVGIIALLLLAGGAAAIFLGGLSDQASPTPTDAALPSGEMSPSAAPSPSASASPSAAGSPSASPSVPTVSPTATASPTKPPTAPPTPTKPPTPAPTPVNCDASTAADRFVTLTAEDSTRRIRRERAWCVHQIIFVAESGEGRLKLYLTNQAFVPDYGMPTIGWHEAYMPSDFSEGVEYSPDLQIIQPYRLLLPRTDISFEVSCTSPTCSGFVQIGYEQIRAP